MATFVFEITKNVTFVDEYIVEADTETEAWSIIDDIATTYDIFEMDVIDEDADVELISKLGEDGELEEF